MTHQRFLDLAKQFEEIKTKYNEIRKELGSTMESLGYETYLQDPETMVVYKIYRPLGTFVEFKSIDYKRTALEGEKGGQPLSKKEAEEKGFYLKK